MRASSTSSPTGTCGRSSWSATPATALAQSSLQTGALGPAVATQTVFDPLASLLLGTLVLGEHVHDSPLGAAGTLAAVIAMVGGTAALALAEGGQRTTRWRE